MGVRYHCVVMKIDVCESCEPTFEHTYALLKYKKLAENYNSIAEEAAVQEEQKSSIDQPIGV